MTLGDLSNLCLVTLQEPSASFTVGGGGGPNWGSVSNPQYSQGLVEFCINQGYLKMLGDLEDMELALVSFTLSSTASTYKYAIPPSGYSPISHVARVFYQPKGLPYTWEFRPGQNLISWAEYQGTWTGQGYLAPYAFGSQPMVCTIDPLLANLYFYPGSGQAGDTITVDYSPLPSKGGTGCPTLVNQNDTPLFPLDCHMAIFYFAMWLLFIRGREMQAAQMYQQMYREELATIRAKYTRKHHGDVMRVEPMMDSLSLNSSF